MLDSTFIRFCGLLLLATSFKGVSREGAFHAALSIFHHALARTGFQLVLGLSWETLFLPSIPFSSIAFHLLL